MDKKQILFVDDNQGILDGLRRALRPERKIWNMNFVSSGQEALEFMSANRVDAIITDMRMPGISGVHLLDEVAHLYPDMIRFILSGYSTDNMTLQAVKTAHQFFPKPCNIDSLKTALTRSFSLRDLLINPRLRSLVSGMEVLPSMPNIYSEIVEKLNSPEVSVSKIGEVISRDPAISTKIIQLVNSSFFGLGRHIYNPEEAATLLGIDVIKHLALSVGLFSQFDERKLIRSGFVLENSVEHSIKVGLLAQKIALSEKADKRIVDQSYLSGFLHDVGIFVLVDSMPEEYRRVIDLQQMEQMDIYVAEREVFGNDHAAVGAYLFGLWGFSDEVLEAVAFHHTPSISKGTQFAPLTAVHVASELENVRSHRYPNPLPEGLDMRYLETLGLADRIPEWEALCDDISEE